MLHSPNAQLAAIMLLLECVIFVLNGKMIVAVEFQSPQGFPVFVSP